MPRGGKREGAGRPPGRRNWYRLDATAARMAREIAEARNLTQDEAVRLAVVRLWQAEVGQSSTACDTMTP